MDKEQFTAFVNSQITCAQIEALGMQAENQKCIALGLPIAYDSLDFAALIDRFGISHNSIISGFQRYS